MGRQRQARRWAGWVVVVALLALAAFGWAGAASRGQSAAAAGTAVGTGSLEESEGRRLFVQGCSDCHGLDARGIDGRGPSLIDAGAAAADFYLRTGRMPLDRPNEEPVRTSSPYTPEEREALVEYVGGLGDGPPIPSVDPEAGDVAAGRKLFTEHCAGCHQVVGQGGILPGAVVPSLNQSSPVDVAEAMTVGPYVMPSFERLSPSEVDDIARYVEEIHDPDDAGGWGLGHIGPIPEGMVAWLLAGAALLLAIRLIGERTKS
ncbi:MAG TPA: c-type cytochrome [Solirubrobacterales bacterium]|nr:c-type cytochrome [Solirubrobacterales bacterium]